jgi:predicted enzyme related to lactoylglutathione lyase
MNTNTNPVTWFEIYTHDIERAKTFYERVFSYALEVQPTDGSFEAYLFPGKMPGNGAMGALLRHPLRQPSSEGNLIYFHCMDCGVTAELALRNGGSIFKSKMSIGSDGFIAIIGDTEGNAIGIHSFE